MSAAMTDHTGQMWSDLTCYSQELMLCYMLSENYIIFPVPFTVLGEKDSSSLLENIAKVENIELPVNSKMQTENSNKGT